MISVIVGLVGVGLLVYLLLIRRRRGRVVLEKPAKLLLWRLARWELHAVTVSRLGLEVHADLVYPLSVAQLVDLPDCHLYVMAVEPAALIEHETLEAARRTIVLGTIFKPGGDLLRYLQFAAVVVPLIVCIWLTMQVGGINGQLRALSDRTAVVVDILSKPLTVKR